MKISTEKPPIMWRITKVFGVRWESGVIITYGNTVYCKAGSMSNDLVVHERTHIGQQMRIGKEEWWEKYFTDPDFRLEQEIEAYKNQIRYIKEHVKDANTRFQKIHHIWQSMSKNYGDMITFTDAQRLLPYRG